MNNVNKIVVILIFLLIIIVAVALMIKLYIANSIVYKVNKLAYLGREQIEDLVAIKDTLLSLFE